jgi:hypothetical protein
MVAAFLYSGTALESCPIGHAPSELQDAVVIRKHDGSLHSLVAIPEIRNGDLASAERLFRSINEFGLLMDWCRCPERYCAGPECSSKRFLKPLPLVL